MSKQLEKISDKAIHVEVYHTLCRAAEEFYRLSVNVPKTLLEVTQHIHGRFDMALYDVFIPANKEHSLQQLSIDIIAERLLLVFVC